MSAPIERASVSRFADARRLLVLFILLQIVLSAFLVSRSVLEPAAVSSEAERLETHVPVGFPLSIETGLDGATKIAQRWSADAWLMSATMQVEWPRAEPEATSSEIPKGGWIIYIFGSEGGEGLSLLIDRVGHGIFDQDVVVWTDETRKSIFYTTYPISSITAQFAAETIYGATFRGACPAFRHLSRVSFVPNMNGVGAHWAVSYEDARSLGGPAFVVRIDANEGLVIRDEIHRETLSECVS